MALSIAPTGIWLVPRKLQPSFSQKPDLF